MDSQNRLQKVVHAATAKTYSYGYDYRTRRVQRDEGTERARLSFSGGVSVIERSSADPAKTKHFVRGSDMGGGVGGLLYSVKAPDNTIIIDWSPQFIPAPPPRADGSYRVTTLLVALQPAYDLYCLTHAFRFLHRTQPGSWQLQWHSNHQQPILSPA